jgi:enoyl-CoA hydratase/carnithine racemase
VAYENYEALRVTVDGGVARATIDHPPINLLDLTLMLDLDRFGREVEADPEVRVVVLDSANEEFFIPHADVGMILSLPRDPVSVDEDAPLGFFHAMVDRFRTMPKATVAVIEGRVRGGGSELVLSMDMRFADRDRAVLSQPEVALGIIPGGSGTQRLPRLVGRSRALEIVLGCGDIDAATAERWGYVNRALPSGALRPFVDELVGRMGSFPAGAIAAAKASVLAADPDPRPGLHQEWARFVGCLADPEAARRMERFLAVGGQTADGERDLTSLYGPLAAAP